MTTVVAALLECDGRVLIAQRRPDGPHPLKWEFPGGKVEPGETPYAALVRELREELAIVTESASELTHYEYQYPGRPPILLMFYRVERFTGRPLNLAFQRIEWTAPASLVNYDFLDGDRDFIGKLANAAR